MKKATPPVVLVSTWLYIACSKEIPFESRKKSIQAITKWFGSFEIARIYIEQSSLSVQEKVIA